MSHRKKPYTYPCQAPGGAPRFWVRYHNIPWRNLGSQRWRGAKVWMLT